MEDQHARLTVLMDAGKKREFDELCGSLGTTSSAVVRQLIREFLDGGAAAPDLLPPARRGRDSRRKNELESD